jgi:hypothetical protein
MKTRTPLLASIGVALVGFGGVVVLAPISDAADTVSKQLAASVPYGDVPAAVPGTVEAENYDTGGPGVAYNVGSVNGTAKSYRADGVDLEATSAAGGGFNLGWTSSGQWFRYTVNVATAGTYTVSLEVAAPQAAAGAFHLADAAGAGLSGPVNVPATGNWQAWQTVAATVTLPAGRQVLTLNEDNGGWNINKATFSLSKASPPSGGVPSATPSTTATPSPDGQGVACGGKPDGTDICKLPYYRMRVEYLDQGDWTDLTVADPAKVIKVKELSMVGTPVVHVIDKQHIGLNTKYGSDLKVVVDYALKADAVSSPFSFKITKGGAGTVTARISTVVGDTVTLVKEVNKQAGALNFTVDLSSLKNVSPTQAPIVDVPRMGMALYYPWYSLSSWSSPVLIDKPRTPYASNSPADVGRQMDQAKSAGINSFVVSWTGQPERQELRHDARAGEGPWLQGRRLPRDPQGRRPAAPGERAHLVAQLPDLDLPEQSGTAQGARPGVRGALPHRLHPAGHLEDDPRRRAQCRPRCLAGRRSAEPELPRRVRRHVVRLDLHLARARGSLLVGAGRQPGREDLDPHRESRCG